MFLLWLLTLSVLRRHALVHRARRRNLFERSRASIGLVRIHVYWPIRVSVILRVARARHSCGAFGGEIASANGAKRLYPKNYHGSKQKGVLSRVIKPQPTTARSCARFWPARSLARVEVSCVNYAKTRDIYTPPAVLFACRQRFVVRCVPQED